MQYNDINSNDKALNYIAEITKYMELIGNTRIETEVYGNRRVSIDVRIGGFEDEIG